MTGVRNLTTSGLASAADPLVPANRRPPHTRRAYSTTEPDGRLRSADVELLVEASASWSRNDIVNELLSIAELDPDVTGVAARAVEQLFAAAGQLICELPVDEMAPLSCVEKALAKGTGTAAVTVDAGAATTTTPAMMATSARRAQSGPPRRRLATIDPLLVVGAWRSVVKPARTAGFRVVRVAETSRKPTRRTVGDR